MTHPPHSLADPYTQHLTCTNPRTDYINNLLTSIKTNNLMSSLRTYDKVGRVKEQSTFDSAKAG